MSISSGKVLIETKDGAASVVVERAELKNASFVIKALNHKLRLAIVRLLMQQPKTPVTPIYVKLRLEQSVASQHLGIMRRAGIVKGERKGKFIYYSVDVDRIKEIQKIAKSLLQPNDGLF